MRTSIDSHIFETGTPKSTARCCTRLTEFHDSTSSVMLAMPVIRRSPCSQRGGTEICRFTSLLTRSSAVPIHLHNDFRVQRRQDHQLHGVFSLVIPHQVIVRTRNNCARCAQRQRRSNARCHHANRLQNDVLDGHRLETLHACLHGAHKCQAHATVHVVKFVLLRV